MRFHFIATIISILLHSCSLGEQNKEQKQTEVSDETPTKKIEETSSKTDELLIAKTDELNLIFSKLANTFPLDSSSLRRFYLKTFPGKTTEKMQKQIDRISGMLEPQIISNYNKVANELKPLLLEIIETNEATKEQALRFANLYSIYDDFRGDALFSKLLIEDENYSLVWNSMQIMTNSSGLDTTYISSLIQLNNSIRTNAELAQKMEEFIIEAIKNNPNGFVEMYSNRTTDGKIQIADHAKMWGDPVPELVSLFEELIENSEETANKELLEELLEKIRTPS